MQCDAGPWEEESEASSSGVQEQGDVGAGGLGPLGVPLRQACTGRLHVSLGSFQRSWNPLCINQSASFPKSFFKVGIGQECLVENQASSSHSNNPEFVWKWHMLCGVASPHGRASEGMKTE